MLGALLGHRFSVRGSRRAVSRGTGVVPKLFGLPFLVAGSLVLYFGSTGSLELEDGERVPLWIQLLATAIVGLPMFGFGVAAVLGRWGVVVDREAGVLETWSGAVVPMRRRRRKLGRTKHVVLRRSARSRGSASAGDARSSTVFAVQLDGAGTPELDTFTNERAARAFAERAARTLGLGMENRLSEPVDVRAPEALDRPLAERLRDEGAEEPPRRPAQTRVRVESGAPGGAVSLPRVGLRGWSGRALFAALAAYFGWLALPMLRDGDRVSLGFAAAVGGVGVLVLARAFGDHFLAERLEVGAEGLTVTRRLGPVGRRRTLGLRELEELYFDGAEVHAVSDASWVRFGGAHSEEDLAYVVGLARAWLLRVLESAPATGDRPGVAGTSQADARTLD